MDYGDTVVSPGGQEFVDSISTVSFMFGLFAFVCLCWQFAIILMANSYIRAGYKRVKIGLLPSILFVVFVILAYVLR